MREVLSESPGRVSGVHQAEYKIKLGGIAGTKTTQHLQGLPSPAAACWCSHAFVGWGLGGL